MIFGALSDIIPIQLTMIISGSLQIILSIFMEKDKVYLAEGYLIEPNQEKELSELELS